MDTNSPHTDGSRAAHKTHTRTDETSESMTVWRKQAAPERYQSVSRWSMLLHNIPLYMKVMCSSFIRSQEFLYILTAHFSMSELIFLNK